MALNMKDNGKITQLQEKEFVSSKYNFMYILISTNGDKYKGTWNAGKKEGKGIYFLYFKEKNIVF
jgi:hypothetical protein